MWSQSHQIQTQHYLEVLRQVKINCVHRMFVQKKIFSVLGCLHECCGVCVCVCVYVCEF